MLKKEIIIVLLILASPVLAAQHLEFERALENNIHQYNILIADLEGKSQEEFEKAEKELEESCESIWEKQSQGLSECYDECTEDKYKHYEDCRGPCERDINSEALGPKKAEYKKAAALYLDYNQEILKMVLPPSKQEKALPELEQIFNEYITCIDAIEEDILFCSILTPPITLSDVLEKKCEELPNSLISFQEKYFPYKIEIGKTLEEWREIIPRKTGVNSQASKAAANCENAIEQLRQSCSKNEGWMVDIAVDISVFGSDQPYEYQEIAAEGDCPQGSSPRTTVDTKLFDSGTADYQVICSVNCYSWECEAALDDHVKEVDRKSEVGPKEVRVQRADGTFKAKDDSSIDNGDVIRTGEGKSFILGMLGDSKVRFGPGSTIEIAAFDLFNEEYSYVLKEGRMSADIKSGSVTVRTPAATYTITGTEFILKYDEETKISTLHLFEGEIELTTLAGETKKVVAGETVVSQEDEVKIIPLSVSEEEWNSMLEEMLSAKEKAPNLVIPGFVGSAIGFVVVFLFFLLKRRKPKSLEQSSKKSKK